MQEKSIDSFDLHSARDKITLQRIYARTIADIVIKGKKNLTIEKWCEIKSVIPRDDIYTEEFSFIVDNLSAIKVALAAYEAIDKIKFGYVNLFDVNILCYCMTPNYNINKVEEIIDQYFEKMGKTRFGAIIERAAKDRTYDNFENLYKKEKVIKLNTCYLF